MKWASLFIFLIAVFSNSLKAQEITMFPGIFSTQYYQDDQQISKAQLESLLVSNPSANLFWNKSKQHKVYSFLSIGAELGFLVWQSNRIKNNKSQTLPLIGVIGSAIAAIGFTVSSNNLKKNAILTYNQGLETYSLDLGVSQNGLGLSLTF